MVSVMGVLPSTIAVVTMLALPGLMPAPASVNPAVLPDDPSFVKLMPRKVGMTATTSLVVLGCTAPANVRRTPAVGIASSSQLAGVFQLPSPPPTPPSQILTACAEERTSREAAAVYERDFQRWEVRRSSWFFRLVFISGLLGIVEFWILDACSRVTQA